MPHYGVNQQPLPEIFSCLGDGHDGIWNLFEDIGTEEQRFEILDWYHLIENLYKTNLSNDQKLEIKQLLWHGKFDETVNQLQSWQDAEVTNFLAYLKKHKTRIHNYYYFQSEGIPIGSGAVESLVKQIDRRVQISGTLKIFLKFSSNDVLISMDIFLISIITYCKLKMHPMQTD